MISKPMGLQALNQFPQRAERLLPIGATHQPGPMSMVHAAMGHPGMVQAPSTGGIHSLAPRFAPKFQPKMMPKLSP